MTDRKIDSSFFLAGGLLAVLLTAPAQAERGIASYYADKFHGRKTACGQRFNQHKLTAAHRYLPCGSKVQVTHLGSGRKVVVSITDRGPFRRGRIIDLSKAAARKLRMLRRGLAKVQVKVLSRPR